jgi:curli biogenesis system outer membrane secretion channel CsgG
MKVVRRTALASFVVTLVLVPLCAAQDFQSLASSISKSIAASGRKTVAVTDFTDLDGNPTKLGRYLAEEFSDALFSEAKGFDVIDRTNLKAILQEHKLATTGLIDPATARKLGQIAGVETLVTATITPFEESVRLSLKVVDTETAKIIASSRYDVPRTKTISDLIATSEVTALGSAEHDQDGRSTQRSSPFAAMPPSITRDELLFVPRGCRNSGSKMVCTFGVTNKAALTHRVWFTTDATFLVDDLGNQYRVSFTFGPSSSAGGSTDLLPDVPINLVVEAQNVPDAAGVMHASLSYGFQDRTDQYAGPQWGKVMIRALPISRP